MWKWSFNISCGWIFIDIIVIEQEKLVLDILRYEIVIFFPLGLYVCFFFYEIWIILTRVYYMCI